MSSITRGSTEKEAASRSSWICPGISTWATRKTSGRPSLSRPVWPPAAYGCSRWTASPKRWTSSLTADTVDARIDHQIARFEPIGLEELNRASALMKRLERKYVLDARMLPDFLGALADDFRILVIDGRTRHRYQSSYFDTADLMCFRAHNQQRLNRFKLRVRHYVDSGLQFLELKEKTRVSETSKSRIALGTSHQPGTLDQALAQIIGAKGLSPDDFQTSLVVGYDRLTL